MRNTHTRPLYTRACLLLAVVVSCASAAHAGPRVWPRGVISVSGITALAINPANPSTLYAGTAGSGVFKSTDSGGTWVATNSGLTNPIVVTLAIDPATPSTLYAATQGGVFRSTDSGITWTYKGLTDLSALAIDPKTPSTLYAATHYGDVFKSTDSGGTWAGKGLNDVSALAIDPVTPSTLYAGGTYGEGVFKSTDAGGTWIAANAGLGDLTGVEIPTLAINPATPTTLYAGLISYELTNGVFKSTDAGGTWTSEGALIYVWTLAIDPVTPSTLYVGTISGEVFKSTDAGETWVGTLKSVNSQVPFEVFALAIDPVTPSTLYAGTLRGVVFKSTDAGGTWFETGVTSVNAITASFSFTPSSPSAGQTIQFTDTSTGSPTSWSWDFGDGFSSTAQSPAHAFATAGAFPVTLTASSSTGSNATTRTVTVASAGASSCVEDAATMCLASGRYEIRSHWRNQYAGGAVSTLLAAKLTDVTGAFWLSDASTYEYLIRINTATDNGRAWIAIPTFTDVEFWIDVTDTVSGQSKEYHSPAGNRTLIFDPYFFVYP